MPVRFPGRDVHHVTNLELSGRLILGADEARAHGDSKDLTALMSMPVSPGTRREADVVAHAVGSGEDGIHMHRAGECFGRLTGGCVGFVRRADELHD